MTNANQVVLDMISDVIFSELGEVDKSINRFENDFGKTTSVSSILEKTKKNYEGYNQIRKEVLKSIKENYPIISKIRIESVNPLVFRFYYEGDPRELPLEFQNINMAQPGSAFGLLLYPRYAKAGRFDITELDNEFNLSQYRSLPNSNQEKYFLQSIKEELSYLKDYSVSNQFIGNKNFLTVRNKYLVSLDDEKLSVSLVPSIIPSTSYNGYLYLDFDYEAGDYDISTNVRYFKSAMEKNIETPLLTNNNWRIESCKVKELVYSKLKISSAILPEHLK